MGHFIRCDCGAEGLYIEKDEDKIYISLFHCSPYKMSIKHKLNWIWQIIKGQPYKDCVILDTSKTKEIMENL